MHTRYTRASIGTSAEAFNMSMRGSMQKDSIPLSNGKITGSNSAASQTLLKNGDNGNHITLGTIKDEQL